MEGVKTVAWNDETLVRVVMVVRTIYKIRAGGNAKYCSGQDRYVCGTGSLYRDTPPPFRSNGDRIERRRRPTHSLSSASGGFSQAQHLRYILCLRCPKITDIDLSCSKIRFARSRAPIPQTIPFSIHEAECKTSLDVIASRKTCDSNS